ncbi:MAG: hypothetical protein ACRED9_03880 [Caulobacteraceae bacterium]
MADTAAIARNRLVNLNCEYIRSPPRLPAESGRICERALTERHCRAGGAEIFLASTTPPEK